MTALAPDSFPHDIDTADFAIVVKAAFSKNMSSYRSLNMPWPAQVRHSIPFASSDRAFCANCVIL
jgi:hypothetical protein